MQKYHLELLTDFSGYSPIQIIYKPQLVYYLHKLFLIFQVKSVSLLMALPLLVSSFTSRLHHWGFWWSRYFFKKKDCLFYYWNAIGLMNWHHCPLSHSRVVLVKVSSRSMRSIWFKNHIRGEISIRTHFLISTCANISETGFSCIQTVSSTGDLENVLAETWNRSKMMLVF